MRKRFMWWSILLRDTLMTRKIIRVAAFVLAGALSTHGVGAQVDNTPTDELKRLFPKTANPDGTLNCFPGCGNPVTLCC